MGRALLLASAAIGVAMLPLGAAQAQTAFDWSGLYVGVHGGFLDGSVHVSDEGIPASGNLQGPLAGILAGYNFPASPVAPAVVGVEADFGFGELNGTGSATDAVTGVFTYDFDWDAHARLRVGMPMGTAMPFVAGGIAFAALHISEGGSVISAGGIYTGLTLGAGLDLKLAPNMIARIEGLADHYMRKTFDDYSVDFSAWTVRGAFIFRLP
jgi:opacity protein-like surface antigen